MRLPPPFTFALALLSTFVVARADTSPDPDRATHHHLAPGTDLGMWVWDREDIATAEERARLLAFCQTHGINRLLVQIYYDRADDGYTVAIPDAYRSLIADASATGIVIEALDGAAEAAFAENRANTLAHIRAILEFNRTQPRSARFAGIHLDIEPYTSDRWKAGEVQAVIREFLETATAIRDVVHASDSTLTVAYDIPSWFDQPTFDIEHAGTRKPFSQHIQDLSDFVGIMSYRTSATGPNSAADIASDELAYGAKIDRPVYLSLETVPLPDEPSITFHGRPRGEYVATIRELAAFRASDPARGGILLHYYRTIRPLLENNSSPSGS